ncbi:hypothetical protein NKH18_02570 [Streptomyces sp. M10(2022)]
MATRHLAVAIREQGLNGYRLTTHPGEIAANCQWNHSVRAHRTLLPITGSFSSVLDFQPAAADWLVLLSTPICLANGRRSHPLFDS